MEQFSSFAVSLNEGVAHLVLGNASKMNALGAAFWRELPQAVAQMDQEGQVRALVISSTGPMFCSGIDLAMFSDESLSSVGSAHERDRLRHLIMQLQKAITCLQSCRFPVLAVVQGACLGAGLDLISACDLRFGTKDSFYVLQEINIGIMADLGSLQRLPLLLPDAIVREMAFTGSKLSAEKAQAYGFLNGLAASHEEAVATALQAAKTIAQKSPLAISGTKRCLSFVPGHSSEEALEYCANLQSAIFDPAEVMSQVMAMKQKSAHQSRDLLALKAF
ncbi:MAG: enoyl-CoA hydratase/isomerase family protein [Cyanobacteria bacterium SZAS LIN-3]|nr:enoyl-CoA hydratase/isomerase family protein [Cyanobacteria bacterium SZAS LIN-3]MBS2010418.1 enoyl-CoA hydratase/isomerase family protein [Cyanobacteria bacterium SZAS TMP-1]